jgi:predicted MFS family arabinose efflux permease
LIVRTHDNDQLPAPLTAVKAAHRWRILAVLATAQLILASIGLFSVFLFLTYYLETIQDYSPVKTGLAFLPLTVMVLVSAGVTGTVLLPRVSPRLIVPAGLLIAAAGMALMTRIGLHTSYASPVLPSLLLIGLGLGLVFAPCFSLGTVGVADKDAGVTSATINVAQQIGASIGCQRRALISVHAVSRRTDAPNQLDPFLPARTREIATP